MCHNGALAVWFLHSKKGGKIQTGLNCEVDSLSKACLWLAYSKNIKLVQLFAHQKVWKIALYHSLWNNFLPTLRQTNELILTYIWKPASDTMTFILLVLLTSKKITTFLACLSLSVKACNFLLALSPPFDYLLLLSSSFFLLQFFPFVVVLVYPTLTFNSFK